LQPEKISKENTMKAATVSLLVLLSGAMAAPALAQNRPLTPVEPGELSRFIGQNVKGRGFVPLGIVSEADREKGTIMIVSRHGQVATIPAMLLARRGLQLRAPAVTPGEVAEASYGGKSKVPLVGSVRVEE
jgi:hypothetical protein